MEKRKKEAHSSGKQLFINGFEDIHSRERENSKKMSKPKHESLPSSPVSKSKDPDFIESPFFLENGPEMTGRSTTDDQARQKHL